MWDCCIGISEQKDEGDLKMKIMYLLKNVLVINIFKNNYLEESKYKNLLII